jgi:hypothetical protein
MTFKRFFIGITIVFASIWGLIILSNWLYGQFRAKELSMVAQLDALNLALIDTLPPPPEVTELKRSSNGISGSTNVHGRVLIVQYKASDTANDVAGYYQRFFTTQGWTQTPYGEDALYIRDTACVEIHTFVFDTREFWLIIWHDVAKQSIRPLLPPRFWLEIYDFGETQIYTCPQT